MNKTPGQKLYDLRKSINKTLEAVASDIGISYASMNAYEKDERNPRDQVKKKLAKYYGTTVAAIFFDD